MNGYPYSHHDGFYGPDREPSRVDFFLLGVVLSLFVAAVVASLGQVDGLGDLTLRGLFALSGAAGALACFRAAFLPQRRRIEPQGKVEGAPVDPAYELDVFHTGSRAA